MRPKIRPITTSTGQQQQSTRALALQPVSVAGHSPYTNRRLRTIAVLLTLCFSISSIAVGQVINTSPVPRPGRFRWGSPSGSTHVAHIGVPLAVLVGVLTVNRIVEHKQDANESGKEGRITLAQDTLVGEHVLPAGQYTVQYRAYGAENKLYFLGKRRNPAAVLEDSPARSEAEAGIWVNCRLETIDHKARKTLSTTIRDNDVPRIAWLEIKGERVAHIVVNPVVQR